MVAGRPGLGADGAGRLTRPPTLVVLGGGPAQRHAIDAARALGVRTVVCDSDPRVADVPVSTEDVEGVRRAARDADGLIAPGTDWPVRIAAETAEDLRIPHPIPAAVAVICTDKIAQRDAPGRRRRPAAALVDRRAAVVPVRRQGGRPPGPAGDVHHPRPGRAGRRRRPRPPRLPQRPGALRGVRARPRGDRERLLDRRPLHAGDGDRPDPLRGRPRGRPPTRLPGGRNRGRARGRRRRGRRRGGGDRGGAELHPADPGQRRPAGDRGRRAPGRRARLRDLPHRRRRRPGGGGGAGGARRAGRRGIARAAAQRRRGDRVPGRAAGRARDGDRAARGPLLSTGRGHVYGPLSHRDRPGRLRARDRPRPRRGTAARGRSAVDAVRFEVR